MVFNNFAQHNVLSSSIQSPFKNSTWTPRFTSDATWHIIQWSLQKETNLPKRFRYLDLGVLSKWSVHILIERLFLKPELSSFLDVATELRRRSSGRKMLDTVTQKAVVMWGMFGADTIRGRRGGAAWVGKDGVWIGWVISTQKNRLMSEIRYWVFGEAGVSEEEGKLSCSLWEDCGGVWGSSTRTMAWIISEVMVSSIPEAKGTLSQAGNLFWKAPMALFQGRAWCGSAIFHVLISACGLQG